MRVALKTLVDFSTIAARNQQEKPGSLADQQDDEDGVGTLDVLKRIAELASRITGNDHGSLGLHPAVYFYGPSGQHQAPMFMGTALLLKRKLLDNDPTFFRTFADQRQRLEQVLVDYKSTIATILQTYVSKYRVKRYSDFLNKLIERLERPEAVTNEKLSR